MFISIIVALKLLRGSFTGAVNFYKVPKLTTNTPIYNIYITDVGLLI